MTDFRHYIYRLAEGVSGKEVTLPIRWDRVGSGWVASETVDYSGEEMEQLDDSIYRPGFPIKTPAGWRYDV